MLSISGAMLSGTKVFLTHVINFLEIIRPPVPLEIFLIASLCAVQPVEPC